jgi:hypothetical protein
MGWKNFLLKHGVKLVALAALAVAVLWNVSRKMGLRFHKLLKRTLRLPIDLFWYCAEYCGFAAEVMKPIPVLIMTAIIAEPLIFLFACWMLPLTVPLALRWILYGCLILHFIIPSIALAYRDYQQE